MQECPPSIDVNSGMDGKYYAFCIPKVFASLIIKGPEAVTVDFSSGNQRPEYRPSV
jgi:hypothetical protein